jgi:hypothetical protein
VVVTWDVGVHCFIKILVECCWATNWVHVASQCGNHVSACSFGTCWALQCYNLNDLRSLQLLGTRVEFFSNIWLWNFNWQWPWEFMWVFSCGHDIECWKYSIATKTTMPWIITISQTFDAYFHEDWSLWYLQNITIEHVLIWRALFSGLINIPYVHPNIYHPAFTGCNGPLFQYNEHHTFMLATHACVPSRAQHHGCTWCICFTRIIYAILTFNVSCVNASSNIGLGCLPIILVLCTPFCTYFLCDKYPHMLVVSSKCALLSQDYFFIC